MCSSDLVATRRPTGTPGGRPFRPTRMAHTLETGFIERARTTSESHANVVPSAVIGTPLALLAGAVVLGVSVDDVESHKAFSEKHGLPFSLLADPTKETAKKYGVLTSFGPMEIARRDTFLIDPTGKLVDATGTKREAPTGAPLMVSGQGRGARSGHRRRDGRGARRLPGQSLRPRRRPAPMTCWTN